MWSRQRSGPRVMPCQRSHSAEQSTACRLPQASLQQIKLPAPSHQLTHARCQHFQTHRSTPDGVVWWHVACCTELVSHRLTHCLGSCEEFPNGGSTWCFFPRPLLFIFKDWRHSIYQQNIGNVIKLSLIWLDPTLFGVSALFKPREHT